MADNINFIVLGIQDKYLEKTTIIRSTLDLVLIEHPLIHHLPQKSLHTSPHLTFFTAP